MSYVKLTKSFNKRPVYIHYKHVVSVTEYSGKSVVSTTALNSDGHGQRWTVTETVEEVMEALYELEQLNR